MSSEWIIGALALMTIGSAMAFSLYHFGTFLEDPRNRGHAHDALVAGGKSASRARRGRRKGRTPKQRLDGSDSPGRPGDPAKAADGQTMA